MIFIEIWNIIMIIVVKKFGKNVGICRNNNKKKKNVGVLKFILNVLFKGNDFILFIKGIVSIIKMRI